MKITIKSLLDYAEENQISLDSELSFIMDSGCCGDIECLEPYDIDNYGMTRDNKVSVFVRMHPLPGYTSCRAVGQTARDSAALVKTRKELIRQILRADGGSRRDRWEQEGLLNVLSKTGYEMQKRFHVQFHFQNNTYNNTFYSKKAALNNLQQTKRLTDPDAQFFDLRRKK